MKKKIAENAENIHYIQEKINLNYIHTEYTQLL